MPLLYREFRRCVAVLTATSESALPEVLCTASVKINQRWQLLDHFAVLLIMRQSDLQFGILSPLKKEKACGHLQWQFREELLIEDKEINGFKLFFKNSSNPLSFLDRHGIIIHCYWACLHYLGNNWCKK